MSDIAIRVEGLGKQYRIGGKQEKYKTLRDSIADAFSAPFRRAGQLLKGQAYGAAGLSETIWALKDVSFEVKHGEVLGIIGRNGAGKSTLLKILSQITEPTEGYVDVYGRVGALLEVGTGFHPELTGRENVYLNGAILGMSRAEIDRKFDEIVDFSGVEKFIDTPVKHYSSGMGLRLGFAVAAHLEPEILVVDEVLAVGDAEFQKKCIGKMAETSESGRTVVFVSHNMVSILNLCNNVILLDKGSIEKTGYSKDIIDYYLSSAQIDKTGNSVALAQRTDRKGDASFKFTHIKIMDKNHDTTNDILSGESLTFHISYSASEKLMGQPLRITIRIHNMEDQPIFAVDNAFTGQNFFITAEQDTLLCKIPSLPLLSGQYSVHLWAQVGNEVADSISQTTLFTVHSSDYFGTGQFPNPSRHGFVFVNHLWEY
ncbi:MAG: ABC transporter ATP-binding protein [Anaerolineales bacterium]|nr:ABC transporter ATP-binding protein [Anaerolineales bacterium]